MFMRMFLGRAVMAVSVSGLLFLSATPPAYSAEAPFTDNLNGYDIAKKSNERYVAHDEITELWMVLKDSHGERRIRRFLRLRKNYADHKRVSLKMYYPEDIRDTGFLNEQRPKETYDAQFLYMPVLKKVRRISAANKEQRWVGSDFFYEDIKEVRLEDWDFQRLPDDTFDGKPSYVVAWVPKPGTDTCYGRQVYWYWKEGFLPLRIDYYDLDGTLWKRFSASDFRINQGLNWAWKIVMEDFQARHTTEIYRRWIFFDTNIPDEYLTVRGIEKNIASYAHPPGLWEIIHAPSDYDEAVIR